MDRSGALHFARRYLHRSADLARLIAGSALVERSYEAATLIAHALAAERKVLLCGNGGSAADAQHLASEFVGQFLNRRRALAAVALTTDTSVLSAIGNDYGFDEVYARQVQSLGKSGDVLIAISTSGSSANVLRAADEALMAKMVVVALVGPDKSDLDNAADVVLHVPGENSAFVQQGHRSIGHLICALTERMLDHPDNDDAFLR